LQAIAFCEKYELPKSGMTHTYTTLGGCFFS
jgi:hypothetical protein